MTTPYEKEQYASYNTNATTMQPVPLPSLNGGLYTGEPFDPESTYKNYPNKPDSVYLHTQALLSANPPPGLNAQFPDTFRPGNNMPDASGAMKLARYSNRHSLVCTKMVTAEAQTSGCKNRPFIGADVNPFNNPYFI